MSLGHIQPILDTALSCPLRSAAPCPFRSGCSGDRHPRPCGSIPQTATVLWDRSGCPDSAGILVMRAQDECGPVGTAPCAAGILSPGRRRSSEIPLLRPRCGQAQPIQGSRTCRNASAGVSYLDPEGMELEVVDSRSAYGRYHRCFRMDQYRLRAQPELPVVKTIL